MKINLKLIMTLILAILFLSCSDDLAGNNSDGSDTEKSDTDTMDTDTADTETANGETDSGFAGDNDNDGWFAPADCDDNNGDINPDADEIPDDKIDNNCNGKIDEKTDTNPNKAPQYSELFYSSGTLLVYISIDKTDGSVVEILNSSLSMEVPAGQNCITMLDDGSLLMARLSAADNKTYFYHIKNPPRDGSEAVLTEIGIMKDEQDNDIMLEGLYTDCDGRIYAMDTGVDNGSADGNRLLRFTGNVLQGDFAFKVISDLSTASVADIDDMAPGIDKDGNITDNPGLAIDTGDIYDFNYETGTGTLSSTGGDWGIHVLGGDLFTDDKARVYLLSRSAELFEMNINNGKVISIGQGPTGAEFFGTDNPGWGGLAGPLTNCTTGFTVN